MIRIQNRLRRIPALLALSALAILLPVAAFVAPAVAQEAPAEGSSAAADASAEASEVAGPSLGTEEIAHATDIVGDSIESWLVERAPWSLASALGSEIWRWALFALTIFLFVAVRRAVMKLIMRLLLSFTRGTNTELDDELVQALDPPLGWFVLAFGIYLGFLWLNLTPGMQAVVDKLYRISVVIVVGWAVLRSVSVVKSVLKSMTDRTDTEVDDNLVPLVSRVLRFVVIVLLGVIVLQELGLNVAGLVAGVGVGGLALALAAQDTVANWFGALMIYTDRPFEVGDWIKTPDLEGVVEEIGLRSTRIRTFSKTVVSVPNRKLADAVIDNFSRMPMRRVSFKFGVTYATTPAMMRETLERMKDILRTEEGVDQTFWLVKFTEFSESSLTLFFYFFTATTDWQQHLAIRESINLRMMDAIEEIGVEAAFPSRSLYIEKSDSDELAKLDARARELFQARIKPQDIHEARTAPADAAPE